jgi:hypothetical protein
MLPTLAVRRRVLPVIFVSGPLDSSQFGSMTTRYRISSGYWRSHSAAAAPCHIHQHDGIGIKDIRGFIEISLQEPGILAMDTWLHDLGYLQIKAAVSPDDADELPTYTDFHEGAKYAQHFEEEQRGEVALYLT